MQSIQVNHIYKSYGEKEVLKDISFGVKASETVALIGPSGCGKTTLLKLINRLIEPNSGEILISNQPNQAIEKHLLRRGIGYVIQDVGLIPHLTIQENIGLVNKISRAQLESKKLEELTELTGLSRDLLSRYPNQLSGGQQQRVGIARALANDAPIILMDEPFSALDTITRTEIQDDFLSLEVLKEKTILIVTHDIQEAFKLADRIVLLNEGIIQQIGTPFDFLFNPANDFVKTFLERDRLILTLQTTKKNNQTLLKYLEDESVPESQKASALSELFKKWKS